MSETEKNQGSGGLLDDPHHLRADMNLLERSIRNRWPTDDKTKKELLDKVAARSLETDDDKILMRGTEVYLKAEAQNQADDHKHLPYLIEHSGEVKHEHEGEVEHTVIGDGTGFAGLLQRFGVDAPTDAPTPGDRRRDSNGNGAARVNGSGSNGHAGGGEG